MPSGTEIKKADMCYSSDTTKRTYLILELTKVRFAGFAPFRHCILDIRD